MPIGLSPPCVLPLPPWGLDLGVGDKGGSLQNFSLKVLLPMTMPSRAFIPRSPLLSAPRPKGYQTSPQGALVTHVCVCVCVCVCDTCVYPCVCDTYFTR